MAQSSVELTATTRPGVGKGAARQVRREGKVPAVIYGDKQPPEVHLTRRERALEAVPQGAFHLHGIHA